MFDGREPVLICRVAVEQQGKPVARAERCAAGSFEHALGEGTLGIE